MLSSSFLCHKHNINLLSGERQIINFY
jgi:hypothetical protein